MSGHCGSNPRAGLAGNGTVSLVVPRGALGPVTVEATAVAPGLYVHPTVLVDDAGPSDRWRLAHHSGRVIARFPSEEQANEAGGAIAPYVNWPLGDDELLAAAEDGAIDLRTLEAVIDAYGGVLVRRRLILPTDFVHLVDQAPAGSAHV